jgi:hypothetical protein
MAESANVPLLFIIFPTTGTLQTNNGRKNVYSAGDERVCVRPDGYVALANAAGSATALSYLNARKRTLRR